MSLSKPEIPDIDASEMFFSIVAARYNSDLVDGMIEQVLATLIKAGADKENIALMRVPGSNELPYAAYMNAVSQNFDCIIALGVVVAGETDHHSIIAQSTAAAFHTFSAQTETPIINGIVTAGTRAQAEARTTGNIDRGAEFARAAIEMARNKIKLQAFLDELEDDLGEDEDDDIDDDFENLFRKN